MRPAAPSLALLATLCALASPAPARAWTEANVEAVTAHVDVDENGSALVGLVLTVHIHGGWLEGLDLEGLDPDIALIADKPPSAVSVDDPNQKWSLTARPRDDGGLRLSFPRRASPRRGRIRISLAYTTNLSGRGAQPIEDERVRISWSLPGWRSGLESVVVALTTPAGASAGPEMSEGANAADEITEHDGGAVTTHVFRRLHLPRTIPWTVSVELPAEVMAPALRGPQMIRPDRAAGLGDGEPGSPVIPFIFLALPLLAALGSRLSFDAAARRRGLVPRPVIPGPGWLAVPAMLGLGALAHRAAIDQPAVTLALLAAGTALSLQRTPVRLQGPVASALGPVAPDHVRAARRAGRWAHVLGSPLLDITTFGGAALFFALAAAAVTFGEGAQGLPPATVGMLFLILLPFALATRWHLPKTDGAKLLELRALACSLGDIGPAALSLSWAPDGARLCIAPSCPPEGLLRYELVMVDSPTLGGFESVLGLLIVTEDGSEAEGRASRLDLGEARDDGQGRRTRLVHLAHLGPEVTAPLRRLNCAINSERAVAAPAADESLSVAA
ncbi:MAG: hypothetical protein DRJ42_20090 [Deltaproteobacteria bacterium]|nr:MAG: hypothetical protein DRJ42_20090 [Deltaproteobacteria bacterium]